MFNLFILALILFYYMIWVELQTSSDYSFYV